MTTQEVSNKNLPMLYKKSYCVECTDEMRRGYSNKKYSVEGKRQFLIESKDKPCADCGKYYPHYVMDFDHVRGKKEFSLSDAIYNLGISRIAKEIEKCDVVCANCHRVRTYSRGQRYGGAPMR